MTTSELHGNERIESDRSRVPASGSVLVYEQRTVGKELVGFKSVNDWDAPADALAARGHSRGAVFHLPELDDSLEIFGVLSAGRVFTVECKCG
jgi:hypothetical protein